MAQNNVNKKVSLTLDFETSKAEKKVTGFVNNIKDKIKDIETAADKMTVFKDLVGYISQMDKYLSQLDPDVFNKMFKGIDEGMRKSVEDVFKISKDQLSALNEVRNRINNATPDSMTKEELLQIEKTIRKIFDSLGKDVQINGKLKFETRIENIKKALLELPNLWDDVNSKFGIGFGEGSGHGGSGMSEEIKSQIEQLEEEAKTYQQTIDALNKKKVRANTTKSNDVEVIKKLVEEYKQAELEIKKLENKKTPQSDSVYKKALAEQLRLATMLKNTMDYIADYGSAEGQNYVLSNMGANNPYSQAEVFINQFYKKHADITNEVKSLYDDMVKEVNAKIEQLKVSGSGSGFGGGAALASSKLEPVFIDVLTQKINEYKEAAKVINSLSASEDDISKAYDNLDKLVIEISDWTGYAGKDDITKILDVFYTDKNANVNEVLKEICTIIGVELPDAAERGATAMAGFGKKTEGTGSALNVDQLKAQLEQVHELAFKTQNELSFTITTDGVKYVVESMEDIVKISDEAATAVRSINSNMTILSHSHPNGKGYFSVADIQSAINQKEAGINSAIMAMGKDAVNVLSLDGVSDEIIKQIKAKLSGLSGDTVFGPQLMKEFQDIFVSGGFTNALKKIDISDGMDKLINHFMLLESAATNAQTPLEKLQKLISYYSRGTIDVSSNALGSYWEEFTSGAKTAEQVFDAVMAKFDIKDLEGNLIQIGTSKHQPLNVAMKNVAVGDNAQTGDSSAIKESTADLQEFYDLAKKIREKDTLEMSDEQAGRYLQQIDDAKNKLKELAKQSNLTEGEIAGVMDELDGVETRMQAVIESNDRDNEETVRSLERRIDSLYADATGEGRRADEAEERANQAHKELKSKLFSRFDDINTAITKDGIMHLDEARSYEGELDAIYDQIEAMHELGKVSDEEMNRIAEGRKELQKYINDVAGAENTANDLNKLATKATLITDADELSEIVQERKELLNVAEQAGWIGEADLEIQRAITTEIEKRVNLQRQEEAERGKLEGNFIKYLDDEGFDPENAAFDSIFEQIDEGYLTTLDQCVEKFKELDIYKDQFLDDDERTIRKENGALEERKEILNDIAQMFGMEISQKDRNRYSELYDKDNESGLNTKEQERFDDLSSKIEEADDNLEEFESTYERIILKLSNGKKLEILPDDKGLRDLYKIYDEGYGETYNGHEIEDIQFIRKTISSYEELNKLVTRYNELLKKRETSKPTNKENEEFQYLINRISKSASGHRLSEAQTPDRLFDLEKLAEMLGFKVPQAAERAETAIESMTENTSTKLQEMRNLADDISVKFVAEELDDISIGQYQEKLRQSREELKLLGEQGIITSSDIEEVEKALNNASSNLDVAKLENEIKRSYLTGQYDYSYESEYNQAENENQELRDKNDELRETNTLLTQEMAAQEKILADTKAQRDVAEEELSIERSISQELGDRAVNANIALEIERGRVDFLEQQNVELREQLELRQQIANADESNINKEVQKEIEYFDTPTGQQALFEDMSGELQKAEDNAEELKGTIKEIDVLEDQISFDDLAYQAQSAKTIVAPPPPPPNNPPSSPQVVSPPPQPGSGSAAAGGTPPPDETKYLLELEGYLERVKKAVDSKTEAFKEEAKVVKSVVEQEITELSKLENKLTDIKTKVDEKNNAFKDGNISNSNGNELQPVQDNVNNIANTPSNVDISNQVYKVQIVSDDTEISGNVQKATTAIENKQNDTKLSDSIVAATTEMKNAASEIARHKNAQGTDTRQASEKIRDSDTRKLISDVVRSFVQNGTDNQVSIDKMSARVDGIVKVEGAVQNSNGVWEGFTVNVNKANEAVKYAVQEQSDYAKSLNKAAEKAKEATEVNVDLNQQKLSPKETDMWASVTARQYTDNGEEVTVQYKDSQRYTVSRKKNIGDLQKEIFQTYDDSIEGFNERTTVTVSNAIAIAIKDANKLIEENSSKIANTALLSQYKDAYELLQLMNEQYRGKDLNDDQITEWNSQINLVQILGKEISKLIQQQAMLDSQSGVASSAKRLTEYQKEADSIFKGLGFNINDPDKTPQQQKVVDAYDKIIERINILKKNHTVLTDSQISEIDQLIASLKNEAAVITESQNAPATGFEKTRNLKIDSFNQYKEDVLKNITLTEELQAQLKALEEDLLTLPNADALDTWEERFKSFKDTISTIQKIDIDKKVTESNRIKESSKAEFDTLGIKTTDQNLNDRQKELVTLYQQLEDVVSEYQIKVRSGQKAELDGINNIVNALHEKIEAYKTDNKFTDAKTKNRNEKFGKTAIVNATSKYNSVVNALGYKDGKITNETFVGSELVQNKLKELVESYENLKNIRNQLSNQPEAITEEDEIRFKTAKDECNELAKSLQKIINTTNDQQGSVVSVIADDVDISNVKRLGEELRDAALTNFDNIVPSTMRFDENLKQLFFTVRNGDDTFTEMVLSLNEAENAIIKTAKSTKQASSSFKGIFDQVKQYVTARLGIDELMQQVRQGVQYVREIDSAMTELKKVTDETTKSYDSFQKTASKVAHDVGTTLTSMISSTADWSRLGYNLQEATELAKNTSILMNVSEFDNIEKATDSMISALKAFQKEGNNAADFSMEIVDKFNYVGNNYAISTADLADSLTRSSASLVAANGTLSEAVALTAAANTVIQNPETVGTTLKTLAMRLRGTSADEIAAAGEETDGLISSTSKLAKKVQELTSIDGDGGVKILTETGAYKSTYQILLEISKVWHEMDDMDQAALLEVIAGKRAGSAVAAIVQDGELLQEIFESTENSAGSAMHELEVHLDSIEGKIQRLTNSVQTMWNNFLDDSIIKFFVDLLNKLIQIADKVGSVGTILGGLGAINVFKNVGAAAQKEGRAPVSQNLVKSIGNAIASGFASIKNSLTNKTSSDSGAKDTVNVGTTAGTKAMQNAGNITIFTKEKKAVDDLNKSKQDLSKAEKDHQNTSQETGKVIQLQTQKTDELNQETTKGVKAHLKLAGSKAKDIAKTIALNAATTLLQVGTMALVGFIINKAVQAFTEWKNRMSDLKEEAVASAQALEEDRKTTDKYIGEVKELRTTLADNATSEQDAYDARVRLMAIQDELVTKYGYEAKAINLVSGAIDGEIAKIDELNKKKAEQYLVDNKEAYEDAKKYINKEEKSTLYVNGFTDDEFEAAYIAKAKELGFYESIGIGNITTNPTQDVGMLAIDGTKEEIAKAYDELAKFTNEYAETHKVDIGIQLTDISKKKNDLGLDDEKYKTNKEVVDTNVQNQIVAHYSDIWDEILEAQSKFNQALADQDVDAQQEYFDEYMSKLAKARNKAGIAGDTEAHKYFQNMIDENQSTKNKMSFIEAVTRGDEQAISSGVKNVKDMARQVRTIFDKEGFTVSDILNIEGLMNAEKLGEEVDWGTITDRQKTMFSELTEVANIYGLEVNELIDALAQLGYISYSPEAEAAESAGKSIAMLTASISKYDTAMDAMRNITYNNMQVSEDYYTALHDYIGDTKEFTEAFYEENGQYIVTNTELLKDLIKQKQKEQAADIKSSKAQARLQYYELYKDMHKLTGGYKKLTGSALDEVEALYKQMNGIEKTIAQYSMLEAKLLGVTNAYTELEAAQAADAEIDYGSKAENLVNVLAEAFNTAQLGTEAAQVAIAGLIPEDLIDRTKTLDEQMDQIYKYFTKGELSKLFTIEFDDNGGITSVEMKKEDVEEYTKSLFDTKVLLEDGTEAGAVFQGTWDKFTLNPAITTLEEFADAIGVTKEVAFAYLTELEKYDISWLGGDYKTLLDQLMGGDLDYKHHDNLQKIADYEVKVARGDKVTDEEKESYRTLVGETEALEEQALNAVTKYGKLSEELDIAKQKMKDLNHEYAEAETDKEKSEIEENMEKAQEEVSKLMQKINELNGEPTEYTLQISADEAQEQIDDFKASLLDFAGKNNLGKDGYIALKAAVQEVDDQGLVELGLSRDANGVWSGLAEWDTYTNLDPVSKTKLVEYLNLINSKHTIDALMGSGITTVEEHLERIVEILEKTWELTVKAEVDDSEVITFWDWLKNPWTKTVDIFANWFGGDSDDIIPDKPSGTRYKDGGGGHSDVNGTAHAHGTAYKGGKWGAPRTEEALVGELGPEMRVRGSRWELIGQNGAEFTDVRKGDVIFNHRQTEQLLKNGHITGRGRAFVHGTSGTAYKNIEGSVDLNASKGSYTATMEMMKARQEKTAIKNATFVVQSADIASGQTAVGCDGVTIDTYDDAYKKLYKDYGNKDGSSGSGDSAADEAKETIDFIEIKLEEIEKIISRTTAELENYLDDASRQSISKKNNAYNELVKQEKLKESVNDQAEDKYEEKANSILAKIDAKYRDMAQVGAIDIKDFVGENDTKQAELINEYREWAQKADDAAVAREEAITRQKELRLEQLQDIASNYENEIGLIEKESSLLEAQIDLVEESGERIGSGYYTALIENSKETINHLQNEKKDLQNILNNAVASGDVKKGDSKWYEMVDAIAAVDEQIINCNKDIESFQNAINDLKWDNLDKLIDRFDAIDSELSHLYERLTDGKVTDDSGNWNSKGIAAMGMAAQQMETAQYKSQQYAQAIKDLTKDYKKGLYSTDEYNEKLTELKENQWESIEAYEDAKDAIIDLNKTRVDAIKDGMDKELDAYKELIEAQKELLDAEKDLHDFEKSVKDKEKNISDIERELAALSGDNSMSANAKRKQLEADLAVAKEELDELYYDRSMQNQQDALDSEYNSYEEYINKEKEALDKWLEDEEAVIAESMDTVKANAETVLAEINNISNMYGIQITEEITNPWKEGSMAISGYKDSFSNLADSFSMELDKIIEQQHALQNAAENAAKAMAKSIGGNVDGITGGGSGSNGGSGGTDLNALYDAVDKYTYKNNYAADYKGYNNIKGQNVTIGANTNKTLDGSHIDPGGSYTVGAMRNNNTQVLLYDSNGVKLGWVHREKLKNKGYAKGTTGVKEDQWAWIDEIGEELVMHAGPDGKLSYLTKGTSVIPHDLTEKLMNLALDPTQTLENSRPVVNAPHITNNEINIDASIAEVIHIDSVTNDTMPNLEKTIEKQMDKYVKNLNAQIRKYIR